MKDIENEADIKNLVDRFYEKVIDDPEIGFIFTRVMAVSWEVHLPIMYNFWGSILLGSGAYSGNPMQKHIALDKLVQLEDHHFERWLLLWRNTVRENFEGRSAEEAISRATNIAALMKHKVTQSRSR